MKSPVVPLTAALAAGFGACTQKVESKAAGPEAATEQAKAPAEAAPDRAALQEKARGLFGTIAPEASTDDPAIEAARVKLGKTLYFETRLSESGDISCNTCHDLARYGVDVREKDGRRIATSIGHDGAFGERNSPTTFNAFVHVAQFWDGRAEDVEAQAKGPVLNPVEMAMSDADDVEERLRSIPAYREMFRAAFPGEEKPITFDNFARAVGAFERKLVTPAPVDAFLEGDLEALTDAQVRGLDLFMERCASCHMGPGFGGAIYQKLGLLKSYPTEDLGRYAVTKKEADKKMFKVPSLRNVAKTGPYLHDGSVATLEEMVDIMAEHQTPQGALGDAERADLLAFLDALTGELPEDLVEAPELPDT